MLAMKPYEARYRVVIISDAHALNPEAGNSLLKVLEEPPDRTILVLTAYHLHDLLPTIASRCQHIRFNPISHDVLTDVLVNQGGDICSGSRPAGNTGKRQPHRSALACALRVDRAAAVDLADDGRGARPVNHRWIG